MPTRQLAAQGVTDQQIEVLQGKADKVGVSINWQALLDFVLLAVRKRGQLTLDDIVTACLAVFGLTPAQLTGTFSFNWAALIKLVADIQAGAGIAVIVQDIIDLLGS